MTREEYYSFASALRDSKPDDESGTVGERRLWADILKALSMNTGYCEASVNRQVFMDLANGVRESWR